MADLSFPEHVQTAMARDSISDDDVYTVVEDYDDIAERFEDGRTEYGRMMSDGRWLVVVIENDGVTAVSAWWNKRRSRRRR